MKKHFSALIYFVLKIISPKKYLARPNINIDSNPGFSIYDITMKSIDGENIQLSRYLGKKILIVNTASKCGFTNQYNELEAFQIKNQDSFVVLGFPANNFGGQESGSNEDIIAFCKLNFGVTFQLFEKSDVIGPNQNLLYKWLSDKDKNGWNDVPPSWNFCKYVINEKGELLNFYSSSVNPLISIS